MFPKTYFIAPLPIMGLLLGQGLPSGLPAPCFPATAWPWHDPQTILPTTWITAPCAQGSLTAVPAARFGWALRPCTDTLDPSHTSLSQSQGMDVLTRLNHRPAVGSSITSLTLPTRQLPHLQKEGSWLRNLRSSSPSWDPQPISVLIKEQGNSACGASSQVSSVFHPHFNTV